jgi:hypothetical protein
MEEEVKKATAIRQNMARLRELRLAKEAQTVQTEVPADNPTGKSKIEKAIQIGRCSRELLPGL